MDPYENLANAIVLSAANEYRDALKKLARGRRNSDAERTKAECLRFFRSGWFGILTSLDPEVLIDKLDAEVGA